MLYEQQHNKFHIIIYYKKKANDPFFLDDC